MSQAQTTITLDMQKFYVHWDPHQKETVKRDKVDKYKLCIDAGKSLAPIVIEGVADIEKTLYIKIADGQHRLQASYEKGKKYVVALDTPGAREAQKFLENLA